MHLSQNLAVTVTIAVSAMAVIPYASRLARPVRSALVAGALGAISGISMVAVLTEGWMGTSQALIDFAVQYVCAVGGFCAGVGALFGHLARQRRRQAEEEWKKHG
jgi:membrane associated rhomboid family serine protease